MKRPRKSPAKKHHRGSQRRLANAFRRMIDALTASDTRFVVIGAQAVRVYIASRKTDDLDLLVSRSNLKRVPALASEHFELCPTRRGGIVVLRDRRSGAEVHLRAAIEESDQQALRSTIMTKLFARDVRIPAPEYLVVMKLASMRGQRKHWEDVTALIRADCIDVRFVIAHLVRQHPGLIELFLELVTHATPTRQRRRARA